MGNYKSVTDLDDAVQNYERIPDLLVVLGDETRLQNAVGLEMPGIHNGRVVHVRQVEAGVPPRPHALEALLVSAFLLEQLAIRLPSAPHVLCPSARVLCPLGTHFVSLSATCNVCLARACVSAPKLPVVDRSVDVDGCRVTPQ